MAKLFANSGDPDQMLYSDLGLYHLPVTFFGVLQAKMDLGGVFGDNSGVTFLIFPYKHTIFNLITALCV